MERPSAFFRGNSFFCAKWWFSKFDRRYKNADSSGHIRRTEKLLVPLESWIIGHFKTPLTFEICFHIYWDIDDLASSCFFRSVFKCWTFCQKLRNFPQNWANFCKTKKFFQNKSENAKTRIFQNLYSLRGWIFT